MLGKYHLAFGISSAVAAEAIATQFGVQIEEPVIFIACSAIGSLVPDIDHPESMVGRITPLISNGINSLFGHRTITHDILLMGLLFIASVIVRNPIFFGIMFGVMGHLFLDGFTKQGVAWNYFKNRKAMKGEWAQFGVGRIHFMPKVLRMKSSGFMAKVFTIALCVISFYWAYLPA